MPAKAKARGKSKGRTSRNSVNSPANSSTAVPASHRRATWSSSAVSPSTSGVDVSTIRAFQNIQAKIQAKIQADAVADEVQAMNAHKVQTSAEVHAPARTCQDPGQTEASTAAVRRSFEEEGESAERLCAAQASEELGRGHTLEEKDLVEAGSGEQESIPEKLREIADPWFGLDDGDAMQRICNESWHVLELPNIADDAQIKEELVTFPEIDGFKSFHLSAKGAEISEVCLCESLARAAVSLDLSGNFLDNLSSLPAMWLRNLSLADNPMSSLDGLSHLFPRLLCVDLSFVERTFSEENWGALAACSQLRSIDAEGASIHHLDGMQSMPSLLVFNLADNELEDLHILSVISTLCKNLQCLDLRENPVVLETGYRQSVARELPRLVEHDNQSKRKYVPKRRDQICRPDQARQKPVHMIDGLLQNERCSCLEGNPCTDPATCLDWHNRERVASSVRGSFHLPQGQWSMGFNFRG